MTDKTDDELFEAGYLAGAEAARAGMAGDIRDVVDFINSELRQLRIEICKLANLPPPEPLGINGHKDGLLQ